MLPGPLSSPAASSSHGTLTLPSLPGDVLASIASHLEEAEDRLALEASCRTLLSASRSEHSAVYWGGPSLVIRMFDQQHVAKAAALLAARRPSAAALRLRGPDDDGYGYDEHVWLMEAPTLPPLPRKRHSGLYAHLSFREF